MAVSKLQAQLEGKYDDGCIGMNRAQWGNAMRGQTDEQKMPLQAGHQQRFQLQSVIASCLCLHAQKMAGKVASRASSLCE